MKVLRVKYCYSESDLNLFLETLNVDQSAPLPKLHSIQYLPQALGMEITKILKCTVKLLQ